MAKLLIIVLNILILVVAYCFCSAHNIPPKNFGEIVWYQSIIFFAFYMLIDLKKG